MAKKKKRAGNEARFRPVLFGCTHNDEVFEENLALLGRVLKKGARVGLEVPPEALAAYKAIAQNPLLAGERARYTRALLEWNIAYREKILARVAPELPAAVRRRHAVLNANLNLNAHLFWYRLYRWLRQNGFRVEALLPAKAWVLSEARATRVLKHQLLGNALGEKRMLERYLDAIGPWAEEGMARAIAEKKVAVSVVGTIHTAPVKALLKKKGVDARVEKGAILFGGKTPFDEALVPRRPAWAKRKRSVRQRRARRQRRGR